MVAFFQNAEIIFLQETSFQGRRKILHHYFLLLKIVSFIYYVLVEKMSTNSEFQLLRKSQKIEITIEWTILLLVLFIPVRLQTDQSSNYVHKIPKTHTAENLDNADEKSLNIILIVTILLEGAMSPNPTVERIVAPQYHPITYFEKSVDFPSSYFYIQIGP